MASCNEARGYDDSLRTYLVGFRERIVALHRNGQQVLVGIDERMRDRDNGRVRECERNAGNRLDTRQEPVDQLALLNVEHVRREDVATVVDHGHSHTVRERRNVEHVEQRRLGRSDPSPLYDDLDVRHDFNRTTGNLGGDLERLEEGCLSGFHTRVSCRDDDIYRGDGTCTRGGFDFVGDDNLAHVLEVTRREYKANVSLDDWKQALELRVLRKDVAQRTAHHGVLAHEHDALSAESGTNLMHLVRTDIVHVDDEDGGLRESSEHTSIVHATTHDI